MKGLWGQKSQAKICHHTLPAIPIELDEFLSSQCPENILRFLHLPGTDLLYSPGKAAGNLVSKVPGWYFQGFYWLPQDSCSSLKLSGCIWVYACLFQMQHFSQSLGNITSFQLCPLTRRTDSALRGHFWEEWISSTCATIFIDFVPLSLHEG